MLRSVPTIKRSLRWKPGRPWTFPQHTSFSTSWELRTLNVDMPIRFWTNKNTRHFQSTFGIKVREHHFFACFRHVLEEMCEWRTRLQWTCESKSLWVSEGAGRRIYCIQKFRASNFEDDMRCMNPVQPVTTRLLRCLECWKNWLQLLARDGAKECQVIRMLIVWLIEAKALLRSSVYLQD